MAFTGAKLIPITGPEIPNGVLVIENGKIVAVGPSGSTPIPAGATRVDASGKIIMPGVVDSHSHIGSAEGGDGSAPLQPDVRVLDSINVRDDRIQKAQAGGLTVVNIMPGSGHLLSGQTLYVKLRDGKTIDDLLIKG
jgi:imidazolonepropionase-like amidohydrolase